MRKETRGALQVLAAALFWSFEGVFCKFIPWSPLTIFGLRELICALALRLTRKSFKVKLTRGTVLGALGVSLTGLLYMAALKLTTAANAIVLQYAMPVFVILLCFLFFRKKPSRLDLATTACVLVGIVLCAWSGFGTGGGRLTGDMLALLSAVTYALVFFSASLPDSDSQDYIYLGALISSPFSVCAFFDPKMTLSPVHIAAILGLGLCLAGGYFFIAKSLKNVDPVTSALLANLEPVLTPVWAFLFLGEIPDTLSLFGAAAVILAVSAYSVLKIRLKDF